MVPPTDRGTEALAVLAEATRSIHAEQPLKQRVHRLFEVLRAELHFRDARLTCWLQSAMPGTVRQQFYSLDGWPYPWDDELMRRVALGETFQARTIVVSNAAAPGEHLPAVQAAYLGIPIRWGPRLWGVLEFRAEHNHRFEPAHCELVAALAPQLAIAVAREGHQLVGSPAGASDGETPAGLTLSLLRQQQLAAVDRRLELCSGSTTFSACSSATPWNTPAPRPGR